MYLGSVKFIRDKQGNSVRVTTKEDQYIRNTEFFFRVLDESGDLNTEYTTEICPTICARPNWLLPSSLASQLVKLVSK